MRRSTYAKLRIYGAAPAAYLRRIEPEVAMRRTFTIVFSLVLLAMAMPVATPAFAARDRAGDVKGKGLGAKERKAVDIVRVESVGTPDMVLVNVTLRGDLERTLGRGRLRRGAIGLILTAQSGARTVAVTSGFGRRAKTVTAGPGGPTNTVRDGRKLSFLVQNYDSSNLEALELKTVAPVTGGRGRTAQVDPDEQELLKKLDKAIQDIYRGPPELYVPPFSPDLCPKYSEWLDSANSQLKKTREEIRSIERLRGNKGRVQMLRDRQANLERDIGWLESLIQKCNQPSPTTGGGEQPPPQEGGQPGAGGGQTGGGQQQPSGFAVSLAPSHYLPSGSTQELCVEITTNPPQPNASGEGTVTRPNGEVLFTGSFPLDQNGHVFLRAPTPERGEYTIDVKVESQGHTATASVKHNITNSQGTCPPP
jgi:hypothetical protein